MLKDLLNRSQNTVADYLDIKDVSNGKLRRQSGDLLTKCGRQYKFLVAMAPKMVANWSPAVINCHLQLI